MVITFWESGRIEIFPSDPSLTGDVCERSQNLFYYGQLHKKSPSLFSCSLSMNDFQDMCICLRRS